MFATDTPEMKRVRLDAKEKESKIKEMDAGAMRRLLAKRRRYSK